MTSQTDYLLCALGEMEGGAEEDSSWSLSLYPYSFTECTEHTEVGCPKHGAK